MQGPHRRIIALCGTQAWCHASATRLTGDHPRDDIAWVGEAVPEGLAITPLARRQQLLGDEYGIAIVDAWGGFDPDQFGAVSGTVRGGGALLLLLPPLAEWARYPDPAKQRIAAWPHTPATMHNRFIERASRVLRQCTAVEWLCQDDALPAPLNISSRQPSGAPFRTADQQRAIAAIHHVVHGHRRRPLVLMADRGRGKSAALGMAAAELLAQGMQRIIITAPHRNAVNSLLEHAAIGTESLGENIRFIPPDELLRQPYPCDLLLVDEAAAIPAPMLEQLLHRHSRIVFATTVHGYEGSGRGFALRFFKTLDRLTPGWTLLEMNEPIRWTAGDPLERLTYDLLLLDASPAANEALAVSRAEDIHIETLDSAGLAHNDTLLTELFGLLVLAHYRTTPLDLRQLLDSPDLSIHVARLRDHVAGIAITLREGGFDHALAAQIYSGERRPRGHLAPQSLAFHCGLRDAPPLVTERIMRIAVHPAVQQRGIGSALLLHIHGKACRDDIDYLSTSFGATPELLRFWQRSTFLPLRIGLTREASSGTHSVLLMRPLSPSAMALFARVRRRFLEYLPLHLSDTLRDLDPHIAMMLMSGEPFGVTSLLDEDDWNDLISFAVTQRGYEPCLGAIHKLTRRIIATPVLQNELTPTEQTVLVAKVLQQQSWNEVALYGRMTGKDETVKLLRKAVHRIVLMLAPERVDRFQEL